MVKNSFDSHNSLCCMFSFSKVGSPSALSDDDLNQGLRQVAHKYSRTLYVPSGALWGGQDIQRMNDSGKLKVTVSICSRQQHLIVLFYCQGSPG